MNNRNRTIMILSIIILLIVGAYLSIQIYYNRSTKEKKAAKSFIELLYSNDMVEKIEDEDNINYKSEKQSDGIKEYYRVTTKNFGIDLNSNYNVIGFNNNIVRESDKPLSEDSAKIIAEKYISKLVEQEYKFKEIIKEKNALIPYYSYSFTRYKEGFPFYSDQMIINIGKSEGYLSGFSNTILQGEPKSVNIIIDQVAAENKGKEVFNEQNKGGVIEANSTFKAFCEDQNKTVTELCYVVMVKGIDVNKKEIKWKYFISTESGDVINSIKDNVTSTIS